MSHQGYLILHEKRQAPKIVYVMLQDGVVVCYATSKCEIKLQEVPLTGCKLEIKAQKRADGIPNSFFVESRFVKVNGTAYTQDTPVRIEFSASSTDERQKWGKALFSWQRYFWQEPRNPQDEEVKLQDRVHKVKLDQMLAEYFEAHPTNFMQSLSCFKRHVISTPTSSKSKATTTSECEKEKITLSKIAYTAATSANGTPTGTAVPLPTATVA